jgi:hypothetical protein
VRWLADDTRQYTTVWRSSRSKPGDSTAATSVSVKKRCPDGDRRTEILPSASHRRTVETERPIFSANSPIR